MFGVGLINDVPNNNLRQGKKMADVDEPKKQEDSELANQDSEVAKEVEKTSSGGMLRWIIMVVVVVVCAGAGFGLGRLFGRTGAPQTAEPSQQNQPTQQENPEENDSTTDPQKGWYYELEPVVACLDEPGVTRYARLALTLRISSDLSAKQGTVLLEEKRPVLRDWLSIYLASLKVDDIRGETNQRRIKLQILDAFNERLFPDAKPQIRKILFKEFVVQ
jgi:flagellar basal body-associated protein FliL